MRTKDRSSSRNRSLCCFRYVSQEAIVVRSRPYLIVTDRFFRGGVTGSGRVAVAEASGDVLTIAAHVLIIRSRERSSEVNPIKPQESYRKFLPRRHQRPWAACGLHDRRRGPHRPALLLLLPLQPVTGWSRLPTVICCRKSDRPSARSGASTPSMRALTQPRFLQGCPREPRVQYAADPRRDRGVASDQATWPSQAIRRCTHRTQEPSAIPSAEFVRRR